MHFLFVFLRLFPIEIVFLFVIFLLPHRTTGYYLESSKEIYLSIVFAIFFDRVAIILYPFVARIRCERMTSVINNLLNLT